MFWYWQQPVAASNAIIIDTVFGNIYMPPAAIRTNPMGSVFTTRYIPFLSNFFRFLKNGSFCVVKENISNLLKNSKQNSSLPQKLLLIKKYFVFWQQLNRERRAKHTNIYDCATLISRNLY